MAERLKHKREETSTHSEKPLTDMAEAARKNYEQAVRTGQKWQEEAGQWWSRMMGSGGAADWQKQVAQFTNLASQGMPLAQARFEDALQLMEKNTRVSADLMKKAIEASQTPRLSECQAKWVDFWTSGLKAMQSNVEAVTELSTKAIDSWLDFVHKNSQVVQPSRAAS
jgi:hypothetical protein